MTQAEVFVRFDLTDSLHLTPSVQWIENSGLSENSDEVRIISLRGSYSI